MNDDEILAEYAKEIGDVEVQEVDISESNIKDLVDMLLQTEKDLDTLGRISKWEDPQLSVEGRTILARREAVKYQINLNTSPL